MIYQSTIVCPINVTAETPQITTLKITKGYIYKIGVTLPPGSSGKLNVRVMDAEYQLAPTTRNQYFYGDDLSIVYDESYFKFNPPYILKIETYNESIVYSHEATIRIFMASGDAHISRFFPSQDNIQLAKLIADAITDQENKKHLSVKDAAALITSN